MEDTQDVAPVPRLRGGGYNITLSALTSSLLSVPSRILSRMRRADEILAREALAKRAAAAAAEAASQRPPPPAPHAPGVRWWAFFTSGYMIGIIALAILVHRIQNVVVPSRAAGVYRRRGHESGLVNRAYSALLPIDLNSTTTRLALHSLSLYLILRVLLIWSVIVLQTSQLYPEESSLALVRQLGGYVQRLPMGNVCWETFAAVCAVTCTETFTRGLDGLGNGFLTSPASSSPFHLLSYSFMLHVYSSPLAHTFRPEGLPTRPDKHVCVAMTIPLVHVAIQHIISIRKRWSTHRFWPSAIRSFLSLMHFHLTLISFTKYIDYVPFLSHIVALSNRNVPPDYAPFPQLQLMPNVLESFLIFTTILTVVLNVITQLLLTGRVDKPLLGLGLSTTHEGWSIYLPYDEDFSVFLGRVGTASLEATGLRGWGNEVGAVFAPAAPSSRHHGAIQMSASGVLRVVPGLSKAGRPLRGLRNEVQDVDVGAAPGGGLGGASGFLTGAAALPLLDWRWVRELWYFARAVGGTGRGAAHLAWALMRGEGRAVYGKGEPRGPVVPAVRRAEDEEGAEEQEEELYRRFLGGDSLSDADDDEPAQWDSDEDEEEEDLGDASEDSEAEQQDAEALALLMDLQRTRARSATPTPEGSAAPLFVAHMMREGSSPMTRRQYLAMTRAGPATGEVERTTSEPLQPKGENLSHELLPTARVPHSAEDDEVRRTCVICTCELREVICWPCRCLSMCNACRESLAAQASASKHRCPCCRRKVEGYSRIFIP
ncbi:hypothetical protein HDZ31DRAFT_65586 [Schizophyllum fasciatum]